MKFIKLLLIAFLALSASFTLYGANSVTGQLSFTLKTAGNPLLINNMPDFSIYDSLLKTIKPPSETMYGWETLKEIRSLESKLDPIVSAVADRNWKAINPNQKYEDFFCFVDDNANAWSRPIIQYSAGAGDDEEEEPLYVSVNHDLRDKRPDSSETIAWVAAMRKAMSHLPLIQGISFRGTRLTPDRLKKYYSVGKAVDDAAFISTSIRPSVAFRFAKPGANGSAEKAEGSSVAVIFIIFGKTGRFVSTFAYQHAHEQEILFANGTTMKVRTMTPIFNDSVFGETVIMVLAED